MTQIPLVETVPGAPDASVESIAIKVGGANGPKGKPTKDNFYGTVPLTCPKGGFPRQDRTDLRRLGGGPG